MSEKLTRAKIEFLVFLSFLLHLNPKKTSNDAEVIFILILDLEALLSLKFHTYVRITFVVFLCLNKNNQWL